MTKPITITNSFGNQTGPIPLSQLDTNFTQVVNAINDPATYQNYVVDTGAANAYVVAPNPVWTSYVAGMQIQVLIANANTTASTLNVSSLGAKAITNSNLSALSSGQLAVGSLATLQYDGTQFQMVGGGFLQSGTGAVARTLQSKGRDIVSVQDFGAVGDGVTDDTVFIQAALTTGAKRVKIGATCKVSATLNLVANQVLDFDGGSLVPTVGGTYTNGVLYGNAKANVRILDPIIDSSATTGVTGINLVDCPNGRVTDGLLTKCNLKLQSTNSATRMGYKVRDIAINMSSYLTTGLYVSAVKGASLMDVEVFSGLEGIGLYNGSTQIKHSNCESYSHTQDGFVIISGNRVSYTGCHAYSNTQSGFTTQRQTASSNCLDVMYSSCEAHSNTADGFDLRGATSVTWSTPIRITATGCTSFSNTGTGFYVVLAEGTVLTGCIASSNAQQGFLVNGSGQVTISGCQSNSNASALGAGTSKAGILIQDSVQCSVIGCLSENTLGATQQYGVSFTGTSTDCSLTGGNYQNNTSTFWNIDGTATVAVSGLPANTVTGGWVNFINSQTGQYDESGTGIPTHTRPKTSLYRRLDGGARELYASNGGGSWTQCIV